MKRIICLLLFLVLYLQNSFSQENKYSTKAETFTDVSVAIGSVNSEAISAYRLHHLSFTNSLKIGYGIRFSSLSGSNVNYTSAPTRLAKEDKLIDTLEMKSAMTLALNAAFYLEYKVTKQFSAGLNIDVLGIGFGSNSNGRFISSNRGNLTETQEAKPTAFNVLLVDTRDIGQLKSEFYVSYAFHSKWRVRGGFDMTFSEYTSTQKLTENNDRFRHIAKMGFIGISYQL